AGTTRTAYSSMGHSSQGFWNCSRVRDDSESALIRSHHSVIVTLHAWLLVAAAFGVTSAAALRWVVSARRLAQHLLGPLGQTADSSGIEFTPLCDWRVVTTCGPPRLPVHAGRP